MRTTIGIFSAISLVLVTFACSGDSEVPGSRVATALSKAQCDAKLFRADTETCRTSYDTCRASRDASVCRDAYVACLPAFPAGESGGGERGGRDDDRGGNVERRDRGGDAVGATSALATCASARATCITSTQDPSGCGATAAECVKRALHDAFIARCADAKTRCDDEDYEAEPCTAITARCAEGVAYDKVPESQCASPALPAPLPAATDAGTTSDATVDAAVVPDSAAPDSAAVVDAAVPDAADAATDGG